MPNNIEYSSIYTLEITLNVTELSIEKQFFLFICPLENNKIALIQIVCVHPFKLSK